MVNIILQWRNRPNSPAHIPYSSVSTVEDTVSVSAYSSLKSFSIDEIPEMQCKTEDDTTSLASSNDIDELK